ncbi:MAG: sugar phosphate nucleotidyltransferase [Myxococcaceae bacterium]
MNGMLLAAGFAERMEPLSTVVPKPALEVLGRPLLASALSHLSATGCARVVVNLHRHPERVAAAARAASRGALSFSWEPELLGSSGGVSAARPLLGDGPVLVGNADTWCELDLRPLLSAGNPGTAVLALLPHPDPARWSSVVLSRDGWVDAFLAPGAAYSGERFLFTGFQLLGARVVASLPEPPATMAQTWEELRKRRALKGVVAPGSWCEAGTAAAYHALVVRLLGDDRWIHPQAAVAPDATVVRSAVGAGCRLAAGSAVYECVLTAGANVGSGCELRSCVVAGPVTITGAGTVSDTVYLPNGRFPLRSITGAPPPTAPTPAARAEP